MAETQLRTPAGSTVTIDVERIFRRWLQDVMTEATAAYWLRRADQLDKIGTDWSAEAAQACRNHARMMGGEFGDVDIR